MGLHEILPREERGADVAPFLSTSSSVLVKFLPCEKIVTEGSYNEQRVFARSYPHAEMVPKVA